MVNIPNIQKIQKSKLFQFFQIFLNIPKHSHISTKAPNLPTYSQIFLIFTTDAFGDNAKKTKRDSWRETDRIVANDHIGRHSNWQGKGVVGEEEGRGGGGGGVGVVLHESVCPFPCAHAPNSGGRTPGSQTPGVPTTPEPSMTKNSSSSRAHLALNVRMDGARKMPVNERKTLPPP